MKLLLNSLFPKTDRPVSDKVIIRLLVVVVVILMMLTGYFYTLLSFASK